MKLVLFYPYPITEKKHKVNRKLEKLKEVKNINHFEVNSDL